MHPRLVPAEISGDSASLVDERIFWKSCIGIFKQFRQPYELARVRGVRATSPFPRRLGFTRRT